MTLPLPGDVDVLAPGLKPGDIDDQIRLLDMSAVPNAALGEVVASAEDEAVTIMVDFDVILHGYPVGPPL